MAVIEPPAWLVSHPPARSQYRHPRREEPSGVIAMHTAENTPDWVAFDGGAEAVATFIRNRDTPGSYCDLVDSDSCMHLVRYMDEAFHDGTGTNPHSYGLSVATRADVWALAPRGWRDGAIEQAAQAASRYAHWLHARRGIIIPAKRITAAQARARVPGFVTHALLDPGRRTDPGALFPWAQFLARYAYLTRDLAAPAPIPEDDDMPKPFLCRFGTSPTVLYVSASREVHWVRSTTALAGYKLQCRLDKPTEGDKGGDVCVLAKRQTDGTFTASQQHLVDLAYMVENLPWLGDMPNGWAAWWKGPHLPSVAA